MRLTVLFLFLGFMQLAASTYSQTTRLNLDLHNTSVKEVLQAIENQSKFRFAYSSEFIDMERKVNVKTEGQTIDQILEQVFKGTNVKHLVEDRHIMLYLSEQNIGKQQKSVNGKVTDSSGQPLPGVSIVIKGTTDGTVTDLNGSFSLSNVSNETVLIFSFVGMKSQELVVGNQVFFEIVMAEDAVGIEEVVAVGYGTQKKANLTGAIAAMDTESIEGRPLTNVSSALQGQMSGVTVIQRSGRPGGDGGIIRIRGIGTMNNANPMVIVDGLESSMDDINPNDIESISVLKDAASAAIYGTRAANGVIVITTKRGKSGKTTVSLNSYFGFQSPTHLPDFLDSYEYAKLLNEGLMNEGNPARYSDSDLQKFKDGSDPYNYPNTDWQDLIYQGSGFQQNHDLSVQGGTDKSKYRLSVGYLDQDGIVEGANAERYNLRFNFDTKMADFISVGLNSSFSRRETEAPDRLWETIQWQNRVPPTELNKLEDGTYSHYLGINPIAEIVDGGGIDERKQTHLINTLFGEVELMKGLSVKGVIGFDYSVNDRTEFINDFVYGDGTVFGPNKLTDQFTRSQNLTLQGLLNYEKSLNDHNLHLLLGIAKESYVFDSNETFRKDFPNNQLTEINAGSSDGMRAEGYGVESRLGSYFGRVNYDYKGKYLVEMNMRYDGSSKFASEKRWGFFPSVSAGWRLSEEDFLSGADILDNLKIRGSYGVLGNHRIGDYKYISKIALGINYSFDGQVANGAAQYESANEDLSWETTTTYDIGLDMSLWNGKLSLTADYYNRYTDDILISIPVSSIYGLPAPIINAGAMRNSGVEFLVGTRNKIGKDFSYNGSFNIGFNKNEVEKFANPSRGEKIYEEGFEWGAYYGYEVEGFYQTDAEVENDPRVTGAPIQKGDLKFKDQNDDGKIDGDDRVVLGSNMPGVTYGLNIGVSYKDFDISLIGQGAADVKTQVNDQIMFAFVNGAKAQERHLDRWTPETPNAKYPITHIDQWHNYVASSFTVLKSDYFRLKNLQVGYNLPERWIEKTKLSAAKIYFSGQNLLTFTSFPKDFDPETPEGNWSNYPQVKIYTIGVDLKF